MRSHETPDASAHLVDRHLLTLHLSPHQLQRGHNGRSHHPCQAPRSEGDPRCNLTGVGAALGFVDPGAELLVHGEVGDCGGYGQDKGGTQTGPKTWKSLRFGDLHKGVGGGVEVLGAVEPLAVADLLRGV